MTTDQNEVWQAAGQRLKAIRIGAGLSQDELAMDADWDQSTLSKVERLGPHMVSFSKLEALVDALGYAVEVTIRSPGRRARAGGSSGAAEPSHHRQVRHVARQRR